MSPRDDGDAMSFIGPQVPAHIKRQKQPSEEPEPEQPIGPQIPPSAEAEDDDEDEYGPALPPDILASRSHPHPPATKVPEKDIERDRESSSSPEIGPQPLPQGIPAPPEDGVREFLEREVRRRALAEEAKQPKKLEREEWMVVPPTSSALLSGLDPTKLRPRQFRASAAPALDKASSLWTETPQERMERLKDEVVGKRRRAVNADVDDAEGAEEVRRKEEVVRRRIEEHNRAVRGPSLVLQHTAKLKSDKKTADEDEPEVIWDHARDMSIGGRLMDDRAREKIIKEAVTLGDRFGKGKFMSGA